MTNNTESDRQLMEIDLHFLIKSTQYYVDHAFINMAEALQSREAGEGDQKITSFYRSKKRIDTTVLVLQYLVSFIRGEYFHTWNLEGQINPYHQFRESVKALFDLLKEEDVQHAVVQEQGSGGTDPNSEYEYLLKFVNPSVFPTLEDYSRLFEGICEHALFWFKLRKFDPRRIRRSDFYMYKLALLLLKKQKKFFQLSGG